MELINCYVNENEVNRRSLACLDGDFELFSRGQDNSYKKGGKNEYL